MRSSTDDNPEGLSPLAIGYMWSTRIMTIAVEMGLVAYGGHWLDHRFETSPVFLLIASILAMVLLAVHLMAIIKGTDKSAAADQTGDKQ
ncbi:MAG: AtpZ/AtpI family protein [Thermoguttaceae bacterium]|nr:AtpZ/AtpI family protein [Thermoguttaceae bacterium]